MVEAIIALVGAGLSYYGSTQQAAATGTAQKLAYRNAAFNAGRNATMINNVMLAAGVGVGVFIVVKLFTAAI